MKRKSPHNTDEYGLLAAIWILSCNDQIAYMTYEGIQYRLGLPSEYDLRGLIASRGELFRAKVPQDRLNQWKTEMIAGEHLPSWIREKDESERQSAIEGLSPEDLFRNQFRTKANAPRAQLEIIRWGLEHIETLRKARAEEREERTKRWTSLRIPLLSTVVALAAVTSGAFLQWASIQVQRQIQQQTLDTQKRLKYYEVELKPKLEGYSSLMNSMEEAFRNADRGDLRSTSTSLERARVAMYGLEPFVQKSWIEPFREKVFRYGWSCSNLAKRTEAAKSTNDRELERERGELLLQIHNLQDDLFKELFSD